MTRRSQSLLEEGPFNSASSTWAATPLQRRKIKILLNKQSCINPTTKPPKFFLARAETGAQIRAIRVGASRLTAISVPCGLVQVNRLTIESKSGSKNPKQPTIYNAPVPLQENDDRGSKQPTNNGGSITTIKEGNRRGETLQDGIIEENLRTHQEEGLYGLPRFIRCL
ncbi:hypothetical protein BB560_005999 [Smittium megazygosporum]|uniref:Uncharacterized protein n=1 Tax=Smittium megazygosporum TaxID=133381 RepID=A0A2T9YM83_9FUNG|nr:hypothetical protein BB560_005999 [Smittium megazygosporum]